MTTTYQIRLEEELKKSFLNASKKKGLDGSMLIRYFMQSFTSKSEIVEFNIKDNFLDGIMQDKNINGKLSKISNKLDKIGF